MVTQPCSWGYFLQLLFLKSNVKSVTLNNHVFFLKPGTSVGRFPGPERVARCGRLQILILC